MKRAVIAGNRRIEYTLIQSSRQNVLFQALPEAAKADETWYSFVLTDSRDMEYRFSGGIEGEGDWSGKGYVLPGFPVTLKAE